MSEWWEYENLESGAPYDWSPAERGMGTYDMIDFHLDLGVGKLKKGRLGIDRFPSKATDLLIDLNTLTPSEVEVPEEFEDQTQRTIETFNARIRAEEKAVGLPFPDSSIESIVTHHCLEHIGDGLVFLIDECHRVLKPGGILRIIVPLFPSKAAVEDPDHKRYFMVNSFETFCGAANGDHWMDSFSVPYTQSRFEMVDKDYTCVEDAVDPDHPEEGVWGEKGAREIRVALRKFPQEVGNGSNDHSDVQAERGDSEDVPVHEPGGPAEARGDRELAGVV